MNTVQSVLAVTVNDAEGTLYPQEPQQAGVYGDNKALILQFSPLDENYRYQIEVVDGSGCYDITLPLATQNGQLQYPIPSAWTAPGMATVRLVAVGDGDEPILRHYAPLYLRFSDREQGTAMGEMLPRWQTVMAASETATERAQAAADYTEQQSAAALDAAAQATAARKEALAAAEVARNAKGPKGDKGDTGPKGDKGDKGDKGEAGTNVVQVTLANNRSSHTPAQMKQVLDNGGALLFNDGYSLYKLDDAAYCKKTEMTYGGKLIFKDATVFEDGSVATYTEEHDVGEQDNAVVIPTQIKGLEALGNLIPHCVEEIKQGYYCVSSNGKTAFGENANYTSYKIPVEPTTYYFSREYISVCDENGNALNEYDSSARSINIADYPTAKYVWFACSKYDALYFSKFYANTRHVFANTLTDKITPYCKKHVDTYTGTITFDANVYNCLQKGFVINVSCDVNENFSYSQIAFVRANSTDSVRIAVTPTHVTLYDDMYGGSTARQDAAEHGLTIANNLQISARYNGMGNVTVDVVSNGVKFSKTFYSLKRGRVMPIFRADAAVSNIDFSFTCEDFDKSIWAFGDSYFQYDSTRWMYHLMKSDYKNNVLLDFYGGAGSADMANNLADLTLYGTPQYVFWCMGMNDGSDTDENTPSATWKANVEKVIAICKGLGVTPVLATIPNVPTINHTGKNKWVRESGFQYVDFAKAVGATEAGSGWYEGMLSSDGVHPAEAGGMALYYQVLTDFPQLLVS